MEKILDNSPYVPETALIEQATRLTEKEMFFRLRPEKAPDYLPGQFFMIGLPGYGEAPFSITSAPDGHPQFELCIRAVGNLTNALHRLKKGDSLWFRGPFGSSFPIEKMRGKDIVFVAGGIGIVPMRSVIKTVLRNSGDFGKLTLIYGSKTPEDILFHDELEEWKKTGLDVLLTIDKPHPDWKGNAGVVTTLIPGLKIEPKNTIAIVIGPPVMYKFVILSLEKIGVTGNSVYLSLERRMKCGLGKCGHCQINSVYVCQEGPVFNLDALEGLPEAI